MVRVNKITDCMDLLAVWELSTKAEQKELITAVIDTVGGYPKPNKKGDTVNAKAETIGAYLCVSNARNYCKLGLMGVIDLQTVFYVVFNNLERALTLLTD